MLYVKSIYLPLPYREASRVSQSSEIDRVPRFLINLTRRKHMLVGERLRAVREAKNLSQGHIEEKTGLLRCYISRCENGHTVPSIDTLEKWTRSLDITMSQLFSDSGQESKPLTALKTNSPKLNRAAQNSL